MFHLNTRLQLCLIVVTLCWLPPTQAQKLTHSIKDKSVEDFLKDAAGLKITNAGQVLVTSTRDATLLIRDKNHFKQIKLSPAIFKDEDLAGIDQMENGSLVIVNEESSRIAIVDESTNAAIRIFSKSGDDAGETNDPRGLAVSANNRIYIADRDNNRITVFNDQGLFLHQFGNHDQDDSDLSKPTHIALDARENVYVLESGVRNRVSIFSARGQLIKQLKTLELEKLLGATIDFSAMTADLNGNLYLADNNVKQIIIYDWKNNRILNRFGSLGQSIGLYRQISQLSVNNQGQLAVLDTIIGKVEIYQLEVNSFTQPVKSNVLKLAYTRDSRCASYHTFINDQRLCIQKDQKGIVILSPDGQEVGLFASDLKKPFTLHSGKQMVAILEKNKLHTYTHDGQKIYSIGQFGTSPGGFDGASHVFTAHNRVYVADRGNNRVQIFARDGQFIDQVKGGSPETFESVGPIAVDNFQNLYVADLAGDRLIKVLDKHFKPVRSIGYKKPSSHKAKKTHALDIDQQNRLYALVSSVVNDYSIRVYDDNDQVLEFGSGHENGTDVFFKNVGSMTISSTDKNSIYINDTEQNKLFRFDYVEYPDAAFGLRVAANKKRIRLEWNSSRNPIITGYEIQAAESELGPFKKLASTTALTTTFSVHDTQNMHWFRVQSISGHQLRAKPSTAKQNQFYILEQLYRTRQYASAIILADRLLTIDPDNADSLQIKADSQLLSGQLQAALISFRQLEHYPEYHSRAIRQQIKAYYQLEQYLDAKSLIDKALAQQPKEVYPYLVCAELSLKLNDAIGAVTCAEDGLSIHPTHAWLRYLSGKAYILAGVEDKGLEEYQYVVDAQPENHVIRLEIAHDLMKMQRYEQALGHYKKVVSTSSESAAATIGIANSLLKLDRDDEAKSIAIKLSGNQKTKGDGFYVLGKIAAKQQKYIEAVLHLTRASKVKSQNLDTWISLAGAYRELNKLPQAVTGLQQAIKANPHAFELYQLAGRLELEQENYSQANDFLDQAVELNPQSLDANKLYARSLFALRYYRRASTYADRATKISPKDIDVLTLQAEIAAQQGKIGSAIETLKTAINLQPASAELQYQLGRIYQNANLFDDSQQHLEKAAGINPSWAKPHVALSKLYSKRRLFDEAIAAIEKAVELDPSTTNRAILNVAFADRKKSLDFKSNAPQLVLSDLNLKHIFSAAYKQYANQSIGSVTLKNVSATDYGDLQLSFQIKEYMDFPVIRQISKISGNAEHHFDFKVTFNNKILEVDEDIGVQVEVKLSFNRDGRKDDIRLTQPMTIYGKNAMVWGDANMVGSFVTPKDDTLRDFVRTVINEYQPNPGPLNKKLVAAMTYFSSLTAAGTKYIIDPNTPYTTLRDDQVDYVQFPRETLKLKSGDCDDLSVLISAGLENLGIETVFLEVPGHLLMMFNTGLPQQEAGLISQDNSLLAIRNNQVWIPLEATMVNASFSEAWAEGARKYHQALAEENLGIIDLKKAWQQYRPVTLSKASYSIKIPARENAAPLIEAAQNQLLIKSINRLILPYQSMILNNPTNIKARMQIAILYARFGLYDDAQMGFDALLEIAPENSGVHTNQGNLYLLQGFFDEAIESYKQAAKLDDSDGAIWVNLSMARYRKGDLKAAAEDFEQALTLNPDLKNSYTAYSKLLSQ